MRISLNPDCIRWRPPCGLCVRGYRGKPADAMWALSPIAARARWIKAADDDGSGSKDLG